MQENPTSLFPSQETTVYPVKQADLESKGFPNTPGGLYIDPVTRENITDRIYDSGYICISPDGKPNFTVDGQGILNDTDFRAALNPKNGQSLIRVNMIRKSSGWKWVGEQNDTESKNLFPVRSEVMLVSIFTNKGHFYGLRLDIRSKVVLATYPKNHFEPRLRPTLYGNIVFGEIVGYISMRGNEHPVYDIITIVP